MQRDFRTLEAESDIRNTRPQAAFGVVSQQWYILGMWQIALLVAVVCAKRRGWISAPSSGYQVGSAVSGPIWDFPIALQD